MPQVSPVPSSWNMLVSPSVENIQFVKNKATEENTHIMYITQEEFDGVPK